jgi:hypothetical protein
MRGGKVARVILLENGEKRGVIEGDNLGAKKHKNVSK